MTRITADHLGRAAFVYIRQSTADQLLHNPESRRRQYGLADRARQLGWTSVEVIDDERVVACLESLTCNVEKMSAKKHLNGPGPRSFEPIHFQCAG